MDFTTCLFWVSRHFSFLSYTLALTLSPTPSWHLLCVFHIPSSAGNLSLWIDRIEVTKLKPTVEYYEESQEGEGEDGSR